MRHFFINALDKVVAGIVILGGLAILISFFVALSQSGILAALGVLIFGGLYLVVMGGMLYLFLGIYDNTKRAAEALERR